MIVFFHGLIGCPAQWGEVRRFLKAPSICDEFGDYLRHGTDDIAAHYAGQLTRYRRRGCAVTLVGNSLGCITALKLAKFADKIVLTAPPFDFETGHVALRKRNTALWVKELIADRGQIKNAEFFVRDAVARLDQLLATRLGLRRIRALKREAQSLVNSDLLTSAQDRSEIMIGEQDETIPVAAFRQFKQNSAPKARLHVLANCGHAVPLEAAPQVANVISAKF